MCIEHAYMVQGWARVQVASDGVPNCRGEGFNNRGLATYITLEQLRR